MNFPGDALAESGCTGVCRFSFSYGPVTSPGFSRASRFLAERMGVNNQRCTGPGMGGQARRPRSSCGQPCLRPHSPYACSPMPGELWRGRDNDGRLPGSKICRLTTFLFGVSDRTDFHVQTFFSLQNRQRGNLCGMHKFLRCIIVYHRMSQFSDARCRGFESPRPQRAVLFGHCSFYLKVPIITTTLCYTGRKGILPLKRYGPARIKKHILPAFILEGGGDLWYTGGS